jgi:hypothetical protein
MKKLLIFILLAISLSGCMSTKYFQKHKDEVCGMCPEKIIEKHDSIYTQKIDTIYRISSVDSIIIAAGIFANMPAGITTDTIRIVDKVYDVSVWLENSRLKANIKHLNDTIDKIIVNNSSTVSNNEAKNTVITKTVIKKAGRFYVWFFWIVIVLFAITIVLYCFKKRYLGWISKLFDSFDYK